MNAIAAALGRADPARGFALPGYRVWGASVLRGEDGRYHCFASRIPADIPFHPGWMVASEIVHAVADHPEGPFVLVNVALPPRGAAHWDGCSTHNPKIVAALGRYFLFYMGSTHPFPELVGEARRGLTTASEYCLIARANKRIGVAVADHLDGPWMRADAPALPTRPDTFYGFLTSNPAPLVDPMTGNTKLIFKARAAVNGTFGDMTIGLATAPHPQGPYTVVGRCQFHSARGAGELEDPYLWRDAAGYHLLAKDQHGVFTDAGHGVGVLAHSDDALEWRLDPEPLAYARRVPWIDGTVEAVANLERASALHDADGRLTHLYFATWRGSSGFSLDIPGAGAANVCIPLTRPV